MSYTERDIEVARIINVNEKKWNTHMLIKCARELSQLDKKVFKFRRSHAYLVKDVPGEKRILTDMIIEKSKTLTKEQWKTFYERLIRYSNYSHMSPTKKVISFIEENKSVIPVIEEVIPVEEDKKNISVIEE
jgi:hypothetical protein